MSLAPGSLLRELRAIWASLPDSLRVMLAVFLLIPPWALGWLGSPEALVERYGVAGTCFALTAYLVIPLGLALAILYRHAGFLALFGLECLALFVQPFVISADEDALVKTMRISVAVVALVTGALVIRRDFLMPLVQGQMRLWRKARRFRHNVMLRIAAADGSDACQAVAENVSLTGFALALDGERAGPLLARSPRGAKLALAVPSARVETTGELIWTARVGPIVNVGVRVEDLDAMAAVMERYGFDAGSSGLARLTAQLWRRPLVRKIVVVLWGLALFTALMLPGLMPLLD